MKEKFPKTEIIETKERGCSDKADGEQLCQEISENKLLCVCAHCNTTQVTKDDLSEISSSKFQP